MYVQFAPCVYGEDSAIFRMKDIKIHNEALDIEKAETKQHW